MGKNGAECWLMVLVVWEQTSFEFTCSKVSHMMEESSLVYPRTERVGRMQGSRNLILIFPLSISNLNVEAE
jgi:hypothetical protein